MNKPDVALIQQRKRERKDLYDRLLKEREEQREAGQNAEGKRKLEAMLDDVEKLTAWIDEEERLLAVSDVMEEHEDRRADSNPEDPEVRYANAFRNYIARGISDMNAEDRSILMERRHEFGKDEQRVLGTTSGSAGGYTVPDDFSRQVIDIMAAYGGMRQAGCTVLTTGSGNTLYLPKGDDTSNTGELLAEGSAVGTADPSFGQARLDAYMYTSKLVRVGIQLLQDNEVGVEGLLATWFGRRLGRITNNHFTLGDDSDKPDGVLNSAENSGITSDKETSIAYADLVSLQHAVDPWYRGGAQWMFNDGTLALLKKMVTASEKIPLWQPGLVAREPDRILNHTYVINTDIPDHATGNKAMLFGDFSQFYIRDVRGGALMRLTERYAEYLQVGFLYYSRHDSVLTVPQAIKYLTVGTD